MELPDNEMVLGPLYGIRAWMVNDRGCLCSVGIEYEWRHLSRAVCSIYGMRGLYQDRDGVINCRETGQAIPARKCGCGYWAMKPSISWEVWFANVLLQYRPQAVGVVEMRGKVIVGEWGYRAEYMYPKMVVVETELLTPRLQSNYYAAEFAPAGEMREKGLELCQQWCRKEGIL